MAKQSTHPSKLSRPTHPRWITLAALFAFGGGFAGAVEETPSLLTIRVDDHRPLAALAGELEKRFPIVVTYEEGPWAAAADVEDLTRAIIESNGPGRPAPVIPIIGPRKAAVSFEYTLDPAEDKPTGYADLLSALVAQYNSSGAPGTFRFEGGDLDVDQGDLTKPPSAAVEAAVTVTAESPLLDEHRISTGATVTQTELEKIPTARDPWAILGSVPGTLTDRIAGIYHLIPASLERTDGRWSDVAPVLSIPVRLAGASRSVNDTLDEIVAQLNKSSSIPVVWGWVPLNFFNQTRIELSASDVPAREVMRQILELLPRPVTWRLNYDPTFKRYYLNFLFLPDVRKEISAADLE